LESFEINKNWSQELKRTSSHYLGYYENMKAPRSEANPQPSAW